ncbi:excinuclease ABC subunit A [Campylobacter sputorum subsp. bubulus]|uniref:Excinuclease ABC subunit A n=1 Tax=Campylobacter sputorum subsp. sputorum TaxID=32024 RepID=A0A381DL01_9BACT|nr:hypothetical protein [Campylobacter sputorum]ASM34564.1 putative membrane protein [Campylobacter sputorum aubsp. sputorum RM3237]KAB0580787.1 excinuclease ABC subunit A [Campylobacter sputorum subsp. sputorum]QEL04754.1 putative membrane protein [Campylobacter sputorum subsp. sputorum]SUX09679.1 excinuclease ABC subunit A [Campylobacter sputorum subsp. bubulus]SUX11237.1 excinuclease ABC subunit A [Campylobacter sputorum subsp. sputorum]
MRYLLIIFLSLPLFGVNLLTYNIYERDQRVDLMLSFDAPYEGKIVQKLENGINILTLNGVSFSQNIDRTLDSMILQTMSIEGSQNSTNLVLWADKPISIEAAMTKDRYGLRVRVLSGNTTTNTATATQNNINNAIQFANEDSMLDTKYIIVMVFLVILIIILFFIKRYITSNKNISYGVRDIKNPLQKFIKNDNKNSIDIIFQRPLDKQNQIMLLKHENRKYLILVGSSNVVLDKFGADNIQTSDDFEVFFEENRQRLGKFLEERQNSLSDYKQKASLN